MGNFSPKRDKMRAAEAFAAKIVDDEQYQSTLLLQARTGTLPAQVHVRLLDIRFGKPVDQISVTRDEDLSSLSDEELISLIAELRGQLVDAKEDVH